MKEIVNDPKIIDEVITSFSRTTDEIFTLEELKKLLQSGKQLKMKFGVDVTAPDLHIGHAVNLWMYRRLQELGHKVIFLIGDFTTQIGDPTGKNKLRPIVPEEEIKKNADAFIKQAMLILHDDPDLIEVKRNSEWLNKMSAKELLQLMSMITHDRLISRDMFKKRIEEGKEIYEHELIYPIFQGYDSVALKADLTIIGSDQLFNEMMGRFYQEKFEQTPQVIITTKITPGIDGGAKQSKSIGNYIGLLHSPRDKFGRIMSITDDLIAMYFEVYTDISLEEIERIKKDMSNDPMKYKLQLAEEIVKRYHGEKVAKEEREWFIKVFSNKELPEKMEKIKISKKEMAVVDLLVEAKLAESKSEARRLVEQGGVKIDSTVIGDANAVIGIRPKMIIQVGKRRFVEVL